MSFASRTLRAARTPTRSHLPEWQVLSARSSPAGSSGLGFAAKPPLPILRADLGFPIMLLAGNMIDAFAGVYRDVALDIAASGTSARGAVEQARRDKTGDGVEAGWVDIEKGSQRHHHQRKQISPSPPTAPPFRKAFAPAVSLISPYVKFVHPRHLLEWPPATQT